MHVESRKVVQLTTDQEHVKQCRSLHVPGAKYFGVKRYMVFGCVVFFVLFFVDDQNVQDLIDAAKDISKSHTILPINVFFSASDVDVVVSKAKLSLKNTRNFPLANRARDSGMPGHSLRNINTDTAKIFRPVPKQKKANCK